MLGRRGLLAMFGASVTATLVGAAVFGGLGQVPTALAVVRAPLSSVPLDDLPVKLTRTAQIQPTGQLKAFELVAKRSTWELLPGVSTRAATYNDTVPGPTIRITEGDTLRVTLRNELDQDTSIHWHGLHVPNAMDGVPGVTQPAIRPGQTFTYEFTASHAGTFMYHPHVNSVAQIDNGLYGLLIIDPQTPDPTRFDKEFTMLLGAWQLPRQGSPSESGMGTQGTLGMGGANPDHMQLMRDLVAAGPGDPRVQSMAEAMGLAADQVIDMMNGMLAMDAVMGGGMSGTPMPMGGQSTGMSQDTSGGMNMNYNYFTINGKAYPATVPWTVRQGDLVRVRIANISNLSHPMHLHGQDFKVIAKDGEALKPEQQWVGNTLSVDPGETYDIAILADNPGTWVFHCHELHHTENDGQEPGGLVQVIQYEGVQSPIPVTPATGEQRPAAGMAPTPAPNPMDMPGMGL